MSFLANLQQKAREFIKNMQKNIENFQAHQAKKREAHKERMKEDLEMLKLQAEKEDLNLRITRSKAKQSTLFRERPFTKDIMNDGSIFGKGGFGIHGSPNKKGKKKTKVEEEDLFDIRF
jgi:hypothetical protein